MTKTLLNRRNLVLQAASGVAVLGLSGCGQGGVACATADTLTAGQKAARDGRDYVEKSRVDGQDCTNCTFFKTGGGECGECAIDGYPAHPKGYCISWAAIEEA